MTPERAEEMAVRIRADYAISMGAKEAIKQAILKACAEQRESDAKICDDLVNTNMDGSIRDGVSQARVESNFATAIIRAGK